ncbi:MAG TPA: acetyl-CoA C-acetyltransferase [Oligoflexus sp.]|uniref:acetyl-CoA C-acetyltransferase n=1 Tax=Oligoflexus sp. TaxID=1971216 RepID=UPI002D674D56|nr:acetyl-CoA C-acetyltransferase [Oligoflexus sp.]HYX36140.1 acetyl-CoA C-acetyltransferase [Oligoflexus sp.]
MKNLRDSFIVGGIRTPFVKSMGAFNDLERIELMIATLQALRKRYNLDKLIVGDVALGAVMNSSGDWNLAREAVLRAGYHPNTPAYNIQRACGTGLEALVQIANKISLGQIETGIAGGVDTNSDLPLELQQDLQRFFLNLPQAKTVLEKIKAAMTLRPDNFKPRIPAVVEPQTGLSMGQHTELMVKAWGISREAQDQFAYESHQKAARAKAEGFFDDLIVPVAGVKADGILRADTTLDKLAKLKPAFDRENGTLTAGNSSALTDGASSVLLASDKIIQERGWQALARFVDAESAAVNFVGGEGLLMAPTLAVNQLLKRNNLKLQDFDFYEIHEAFAGQVLCTLKAWEDANYCKETLGRSEPLGRIDPTKINVNGSSLAIGHPFAATGGRIAATLAKLLHQKGKGRGLISICTAGGMGVAAIFEA